MTSGIQTPRTKSRNPKSLTSCSPAALDPRDSTLGEAPKLIVPSSFLMTPMALRVNSYLRPETAQGHFVNFSRLLEFNNGRVPFASAQIGRSFRNEISPRAGLLRVREFTMAEIEHYVDPEDKKHERFHEVRDVALDLLDRNVQASGSTKTRKISVGEAVSSGIIANETLGYFVARIHQFLVKIGVDPTRLRFRQHMSNEMAHYATDCWDAEIQNSYGWTECVGCADRAAYDLTVHSKKTGHPLVVRQALKEPIVTERLVAEFNKKVLGKSFGKDAGVIQNIFAELDEPRLQEIQIELTNGCVVLEKKRTTATYDTGGQIYHRYHPGRKGPYSDTRGHHDRAQDFQTIGCV
jgi:glycyl-tRNA synthetase